MPIDQNEIRDEFKNSKLYSEDLAPIPMSKRSWTLWDMTAIWIGMAVCIPTYLLASYMIKSGLGWIEALSIIAIGNLIITIPMVLNGHAGVKYGIPFPVIGRASFGIKGIHIAAVFRGIVACGWFGIQCWIGGLAFYAIWHTLLGTEASLDLDAGKFIGFACFWILNSIFIWKGTESIKWLEEFSAPILIIIGILLIVWGANTSGSFLDVLNNSDQLSKPAASYSLQDDGNVHIFMNPLLNLDRQKKATSFQLTFEENKQQKTSSWINLNSAELKLSEVSEFSFDISALQKGSQSMYIQYRNDNSQLSSLAPVLELTEPMNLWKRIWSYLMWLTAMVGFWATMAISISDITRLTSSQRNQRVGQFIGLPGTMILYSFVGIFVTCAAALIFPDVLISEDAPWDPVSLISKFQNPTVVIIAQIFMIIATLSTNIAANVIAPANAFSNLFPSKINFKTGGIIAAILGILIMPWWLLDEISSLLIFVSSFLGPVLGVLLCDYYLIRKKIISLNNLFDEHGKYAYGGSGFNKSAMLALIIGIFTSLSGIFIPVLSFLYTLSWFTGFTAAFIVYYYAMQRQLK